MASVSYRANVDLGSPTPERLQVVNACHLVGAKIETVQPGLAQILPDKISEVGGPLSKRLFYRLGRGFK